MSLDLELTPVSARDIVTTRKTSQRYFCPAEYTTETKPKTKQKTKPNPNPKKQQLRLGLGLVLVLA